MEARGNETPYFAEDELEELVAAISDEVDTSASFYVGAHGNFPIPGKELEDHPRMRYEALRWLADRWGPRAYPVLRWSQLGASLSKVEEEEEEEEESESESEEEEESKEEEESEEKEDVEVDEEEEEKLGSRKLKMTRVGARKLNFKIKVVYESQFAHKMYMVEKALQTLFHHLPLGIRLWREIGSGPQIAPEKHKDRNYGKMYYVFMTVSRNLQRMIIKTREVEVVHVPNRR